MFLIIYIGRNAPALYETCRFEDAVFPVVVLDASLTNMRY
jgi:hypothetical protein